MAVPPPPECIKGGHPVYPVFNPATGKYDKSVPIPACPSYLDNLPHTCEVQNNYDVCIPDKSAAPMCERMDNSKNSY